MSEFPMKKHAEEGWTTFLIDGISAGSSKWGIKAELALDGTDSAEGGGEGGRGEERGRLRKGSCTAMPQNQKSLTQYLDAMSTWLIVQLV